MSIYKKTRKLNESMDMKMGTRGRYYAPFNPVSGKMKLVCPAGVMVKGEDYVPIKTGLKEVEDGNVLVHASYASFYEGWCPGSDLYVWEKGSSSLRVSHDVSEWGEPPQSGGYVRDNLGVIEDKCLAFLNNVLLPKEGKVRQYAYRLQKRFGGPNPLDLINTSNSYRTTSNGYVLRASINSQPPGYELFVKSRKGNGHVAYDDVVMYRLK